MPNDVTIESTDKPVNKPTPLITHLRQALFLSSEHAAISYIGPTKSTWIFFGIPAQTYTEKRYRLFVREVYGEHEDQDKVSYEISVARVDPDTMRENDVEMLQAHQMRQVATWEALQTLLSDELGFDLGIGWIPYEFPVKGYVTRARNIEQAAREALGYLGRSGYASCTTDEGVIIAKLREVLGDDEGSNE